ncbi:molybdopterin-dependent oxidoreductase [bacterium]|nr:molybdopterin-dependent oxidoreductase [bacterium]
MAQNDEPVGTVSRFHTCPLCEANCNLEVRVHGREVVSIRGDEEDVFSRGYMCPKGPALAGLQADPDRLRSPLIREGDRFREVGWDEAFAEVERRLVPILERHGRQSAGVYLGNPSAHHVSLGLYSRALVHALGTHTVCSASTVDQMPKQVSSGLVFGTALSVPVPDLDRTDHLVVLGGNPMVSNGSLMTAPDVKSRLRAIRARGGRIVVVDPRRTRTSEEADEHVFVRPGTDAMLLAGMAHAILAEGLARPGRLAEHLAGLAEVERALADFSPEAVEAGCGVPAATIRRIARELAAARTAAVYGRIGTCTQEFGTLASWLVDVLNVLTGNLDRPGGAMFPRSATGPANTQGEPGRGKGVRLGRWKSRVRGAAEAFGEIPVACLAEEIETPGEGQLRALFTVAGNPALSTPNGGRLSRAFASLELMVSLDIYLNETTRHAHVIFPGLSGLEQPHFPFAFTSLSVRNFARYSRPAIEPPPGAMPEWRTLLRLAAIASGQGAAADTDALDDFVFEQQLGRALSSAHSPIHGRDASEIRAATSSVRGPERLLDLAIRTGPWGDGYGARPDGLSIAKLLEHPHGVDLGPLEPRIPEILRTPSGKIELAPEPLLADLDRLRARLREARAGGAGMVLVGRRDLRSNNSWMHNVESLVSGRARCTLHLHPEDARRLGVADGGSARVRSRAGEIVAPVELTDGIMPGVASLPHGWGHDEEGSRMSVARAHAGVNSNRLADEAAIDPLSGNAVLNGIPVEIAPA